MQVTARARRVFRRLARRKLNLPWKAAALLMVRDYGSYRQYLNHQASKLEVEGDLSGRNQRFREALFARLGQLHHDCHGARVLCLGARNGSEVQAFLDAGAFAVGIDLNPGPRNRFVLAGDFHDIQFPDHSVDIVYSNTFDHALNLSVLLEQVRRILTRNGILMVEACRGSDEGGVFMEWESTAWRNVGDLIRVVEAAAFRPICQVPIAVPFNGFHIQFTPIER